MSLLRRSNPTSPSRRPTKRYEVVNSEDSAFRRRQRTDFEGLVRFAASRDRDSILDELKANEEPEYLPLRRQLPPPPPRVAAAPRLIKGWEFVDGVRNGQLPSRLNPNLQDIWRDVDFEFDYDNRIPHGLMYLDEKGIIRIQPYKEAPHNDWLFNLLHLIHHLALGYLEPPPDHPEPALWRLACETLINRQVASVPFMNIPPGYPGGGAPARFPSLLRRPFQTVPQTPDEQINQWRQDNVRMEANKILTPAGMNVWDVMGTSIQVVRRYRSMYVLSQIKQFKPIISQRRRYADGKIDRAYRWVESNFPLLSAVTREFRLDYENASHYNIVLGAVAAQEQIIFVNPDATISELEWRWVLVHEILHVVLEHHQRRGERDPLLWNVACDYVINNWLEQMGVGMRPQGVLFKPEYVGRDAESIYDELLQNGGNDQLRITFRGEGLSDILDFDQNYSGQQQQQRRPFGRFRPNVRQMTQQNAKRMMEEKQERGGQEPGDLPGDLVEQLELGGLLTEQVEVPEWKVDLAQWLDLQLAPQGLARSYNRLSRRQASVPHIPLPGKAKVGLHSPTYGVILDTSGSMSNELLQKGLAAVIAFSEHHGVTHIRMVMCDTRPYDEGFIPLGDLKRPYKVYGRGGTTLQPAVELLEQTSDFPEDAPILIVTDGAIDVLTVSRDHAFLLPGNGNLPFDPQGPVFRILGNNPSPFNRFSGNNNAAPTPPQNPFKRPAAPNNAKV